MPDKCFDSCSLDKESDRMRKTLFASKFPISEYMDNTSRIGQVIMDTNFHCHEKCKRGGCTHSWSVDLAKYPFSKRRCKYLSTSTGQLKSIARPKEGCYYERC